MAFDIARSQRSTKQGFRTVVQLQRPILYTIVQIKRSYRNRPIACSHQWHASLFEKANSCGDKHSGVPAKTGQNVMLANNCRPARTLDPEATKEFHPFDSCLGAQPSIICGCGYDLWQCEDLVEHEMKC